MRDLTHHLSQPYSRLLGLTDVMLMALDAGEKEDARQLRTLIDLEYTEFRKRVFEAVFENEKSKAL